VFCTLSSRLRLIVFYWCKSLIEGLIFWGLIHLRIAVPLMHIHRNKIPRSQIESHTELGKERLASVVLPPFQNRQIPVAIFEIPRILVEGCPKVPINCDRRKGSVLDLVGRSGMDALILFLVCLWYKLLELLINGLNKWQTLFVFIKVVLGIRRLAAREFHKGCGLKVADHGGKHGVIYAHLARLIARFVTCPPAIRLHELACFPVFRLGLNRASGRPSGSGGRCRPIE